MGTEIQTEALRFKEGVADTVIVMRPEIQARGLVEYHGSSRQPSTQGLGWLGYTHSCKAKLPACCSNALARMFFPLPGGPTMRMAACSCWF